MRRLVWIALFPLFLWGQIVEDLTSELTVDLVNPQFKEGVLTTDEGGVIAGDGIRVQARKIRFTHKDGVDLLEAEGDLMLEYGRDVYVGEHLVYDFVTREGVLQCGRSAIGPWYVSGDALYLQSDGTTIIRQAAVTTCEDRKSEWAIRARTVRIDECGYISADVVSIAFFDIPVMWLPSFRTSLKRLLDAPIEYRAGVGGIQGAYAGLRYRFLDWYGTRAYLRGEYYFDQGPAGGVETDSSNLKTQWFAARGKPLEEDPAQFRYRLGGHFTDCFDRDSTYVDLRWDYLSDREMPSDYLIDDFDLHTARQTQLEVVRQKPWYILSGRTRVRVNDFQTISQELPKVTGSLHPAEVGGIVSTTHGSAAYLDYAFALETKREIRDAGFSSGRVHVDERLYRPVKIGPLDLTPEVGALGILYTEGKGPRNHPEFLGQLWTGLEAQTRLTRTMGRYKHAIEPYISYNFTSQPTSRINEHEIFSIKDGRAQLNYLRSGIRNILYYKCGDCHIARPLYTDLFTYTFFETPSIQSPNPRIYWQTTTMPTNSLTASWRFGYNVEHKAVDHFYSRLEWTLSEDLAVSAELRYRSKYDYLKADEWNFVLDSYVQEDQILESFISRHRWTALTHVFWRPFPTLSLEFSSRHGWEVRQQKPYNEFKFAFDWLLHCRWHISAFYEKLEYRDRYGLNLRLGPGKCYKPIGHTPTAW